MRSWMIAASLGIICAGNLKSLPDLHYSYCIVLFAILSISYRKLLIVTCFFCGFFWACYQGQLRLDQRLPVQLENQNLIISGWIEGLPAYSNNVPSSKNTSTFKNTSTSKNISTDNSAIKIVIKKRKSLQFSKPSAQFLLRVDSLSYHGKRVSRSDLKRVRLRWYNPSEIKPGEYWQFNVKLKRPHGLYNPGTFDYETWLFQQNIHATGYVLSKSQFYYFPEKAVFGGFAALRWGIKEALQQFPIRHTGLITALAIGDKTDIKDQHWQMFSNTGTTHLMVISGLHVGLVALIFYQLFFYLCRHFVGFTNYWPAQHMAMTLSLIGIVFYGGLAGFSLPTMRAVIMAVVFMMGSLMARPVPLSNRYLLALLLVLCVDPLAFLSSGFWLSFIATGALLFVFCGRIEGSGGLKRFWQPQWVAFIALIPCMVFFLHQLPLLSFVINLLAIPFVSFLLVPLVLLVLLGLWFFPSWLCELQLKVLDSLFHGFMSVLSYCSEINISVHTYGITVYCFLLGVAGVFYCLLPRAIPARQYGLLLCLPLFLSASSTRNTEGLLVTIMDAGQGLATVICTTNHCLVYDTGARFSSRFGIGEDVLVPYLQHLGVQDLDKIIISHKDNDHAGGLQALWKAYPEAEIISGSFQNTSIVFQGIDNLQPCYKGEQWQWDEVQFEFLHPDSSWIEEKTNNQSCVLRIQYGDKVILLSGDIEGRVERKLLRKQRDKLPSDILIAPHHGSLTSSSKGFVKAVSPSIVIFSAGYRNRFNHPHPDVVKRYSLTGAIQFNTATTGALEFRFLPDDKYDITKVGGGSRVDSYHIVSRREYGKYWHQL